MPLVSIIVATDERGAIGRDGGLPWRLPDDLRRFKALTMGKPIVMGRKTWDSIGKPLPGRHNIVITRQAGFDVPGVTVVASLDEALRAAGGTPLVDEYSQWSQGNDRDQGRGMNQANDHIAVAQERADQDRTRPSRPSPRP